MESSGRNSEWSVIELERKGLRSAKRKGLYRDMDEDGFVGDITIGYAAVINEEQKSYLVLRRSLLKGLLVNERVELGDCKDVSKFIEDRSLRDRNLKKSEGKDAWRIIDNYKNNKQNENTLIVHFMTIK